MNDADNNDNKINNQINLLSSFKYHGQKLLFSCSWFMNDCCSIVDAYLFYYLVKSFGFLFVLGVSFFTITKN